MTVIARSPGEPSSQYISLVAIVLGAAILWIVPLLRFEFWLLLEEGRTYSSSGNWPNGADLLDWSFDFGWSFLAGWLLTYLAPRRLGLILAIGVGAISGLDEFVHTHYLSHIDLQVPWSVEVWPSIKFFVPIVGCFLGAFLRRQRATPNSQVS